MGYDLEIKWSDSKVLKLNLTGKKLEAHGQHGQATLLADDAGEKWLLKPFTKVLDVQSAEIPVLDVDIEGDPEEMKHRLHLWRVLNEYVASRLAEILGLNVPKCILVTYGKVSNFKLEPSTELAIPEDHIILDEDEAYDTAEEVYEISKRENYTVKTSRSFNKLLAEMSGSDNPSLVIGALIKFIPDSVNLQTYLDTQEDFDKAISEISSISSGFKLLPFDVWLNDPDRNQGNYLIKMDGDKTVDVYGLDYEMWSFGDDLWMDRDVIALGRSYLTAVIHRKTTIFDPRINETLFRIASLTKSQLTKLTRAPTLLCKFMEYHVKNTGLDPDERIKLLNVEQNLLDFLIETKPSLDKITLRIIRQIGLPENLKELEKAILAAADDDEESDDDSKSEEQDEPVDEDKEEEIFVPEDGDLDEDD
ncbi:MAG: hypothetical protein ACTSRU_13460 [Candidatus Hodarchaeales archaeon]